MLFTLLAFAIALGVLITFHEYGHYWVARRCGVRVERFSVGFGKVLLRRTDRNGTEWALSAIPLGGYVKFQDDPAPGDSSEAAASAFNRQPLRNRAAIVAAGPIANLLLAVLLYAVLGMAGTQQPASVVAAPPANTPAALAGFQAGDTIRAIDGKAVSSWSDARWQLMDAFSTGGTVEIEVQTREGMSRTRRLMLNATPIEPDAADPMSEAGLSLMTPRPLVRELVEGGVGQAAGLLPGDVFLAVGEQREPSAADVVARVQQSAGVALPITIERNGTPLSMSIVPKAEQDAEGRQVGRIGVMLGADLSMVTVQYGPFESLWRGVERTADTVVLSLKMMGRMILGDVSLRNVSGPVTIADYAGQTARVGLAAYISFMALISVSIGVLNLLPIPMLDGGHLLYYAMEAVRGRPLPERWLMTGQRIGLGLLAALMSLAFFNDLSRLFS
ncbi:MAG TPA: RIP metalloprotease RseP [Burkholderiaceae bacterium]|nr:RIP metalloprotease RseP [Burkholderiaceae bacterium]